MNTIIVKTELETAKSYSGKTVYAKVKNKKNNAYFRVHVDDSNLDEAIAFAKRDKNVLMLAYYGQGGGFQTLTEDITGVYVGWVVPVGSNITEADVARYSELAPTGVSVIVKLPEDYKGFEFLYKVMQKYKNVRVCGGTCFCFEECRFGCCGKDVLEKRGIKYDKEEYLKQGCCCALPVISDDEVSLGVLSRSKDNTKSTAKPASSAKAKKAQIFSNMLYSGGKVEL